MHEPMKYYSSTAVVKGISAHDIWRLCTITQPRKRAAIIHTSYFEDALLFIARNHTNHFEDWYDCDKWDAENCDLCAIQHDKEFGHRYMSDIIDELY